jgi:hypothetical protein
MQSRHIFGLILDYEMFENWIYQRMATQCCSPKVTFLNENQSWKDSNDSCHLELSLREILADFEDLTLCLITKFNNFLGIFAKNITNFDPPKYEIKNLTDTSLN